MIPATTVVLVAGPWTPNVFPWAPIYTVPAYSITMRLKKQLSGYRLFTKVTVQQFLDIGQLATHSGTCGRQFAKDFK